jgi:hypothetical protein
MSVAKKERAGPWAGGRSAARIARTWDAPVAGKHRARDGGGVRFSRPRAVRWPLGIRRQPLG